MQNHFNQITTEKSLDRIEYFAVIIGLCLFFIHLLLIALGQYTNWFTWLALDTNFLAALQTPLTVILYYEVILLILAFPRPLMYSMGKQYEIATLLAIRDVLKLVSDTDISTGNTAVNLASSITIALTLVSAVLMFATLNYFYRFGKDYQADQVESLSFIKFKKSLALIFVIFLVAFILFDIGNFIINPVINSTNQITFPDFHHYRYILFWMIFADIVIFMLSLLHVSAYRSLFLYSLFVVTTVLIRTSLLTEPPYSHLINLIAVVSGTIVLLTYNKYRRLELGK